jgi:hypothetical protein
VDDVLRRHYAQWHLSFDMCNRCERRLLNCQTRTYGNDSSTRCCTNVKTQVPLGITPLPRPAALPSTSFVSAGPSWDTISPLSLNGPTMIRSCCTRLRLTKHRRLGTNEREKYGNQARTEKDQLDC